MKSAAGLIAKSYSQDSVDPIYWDTLGYMNPMSHFASVYLYCAVLGQSRSSSKWDKMSVLSTAYYLMYWLTCLTDNNWLGWTLYRWSHRDVCICADGSWDMCTGPASQVGQVNQHIKLKTINSLQGVNHEQSSPLVPACFSSLGIQVTAW